MESPRASLPAFPDPRGLGQYYLFVFSLKSNIKKRVSCETEAVLRKFLQKCRSCALQKSPFQQGEDCLKKHFEKVPHKKHCHNRSVLVATPISDLVKRIKRRWICDTCWAQVRRKAALGKERRCSKAKLVCCNLPWAVLGINLTSIQSAAFLLRGEIGGMEKTVNFRMISELLCPQVSCQEWKATRGGSLAQRV